MVDVFLSYKSDDRLAADDIVAGLTAEGLSVWWDQSLQPGKDYRESIERELNAASCVLVLWTTGSVHAKDGKWVRQEAEAADARDAYVPVAVDDVLPPLGLRHVQLSSLVDWHGDRTDPRWIALVEVLRARIDGREPDQALTSKGVESAASLVRGRVPLLLLALGLAILMAAVSVNFTPRAALGVVGGAMIAYATAHVLLARGRKDLAVRRLLRRMLASSKIAYFANALIWFAAAGAVAWPAIVPYFQWSSSIVVVDERLRPVADAVVTVELPGTRPQTLELSASGEASYRYLRWGPQRGQIRITGAGGEYTYAITRREGERFSVSTLRVWSGEELFRVAHYNAEELSIDMLQRGKIPTEVSQLFPNIIGVVRNETWREAEEFLAGYGPMSQADGELGGVTYRKPDTTTEATVDIAKYRATEFDVLRWARAAELSVESQGYLLGQVFRPQANSLLDSSYMAIVGGNLYYLSGEATQLDEVTTARLSETGIFRRDEAEQSDPGKYSVWIARNLDSVSLGELLSGDVVFEGQKYFDDVIDRTYLGYFQRKGTPRGLLWGVYQLTRTVDSRTGMGFGDQDCGDDGEGSVAVWHDRITIFGPQPELLVTIVENATAEDIRISDLSYQLDNQPIIRRETDASTKQELRLPDPLPGGVLRPGEAIIIPRKLRFRAVKNPTRQLFTSARAESVASLSISAADFPENAFEGQDMDWDDANDLPSISIGPSESRVYRIRHSQLYSRAGTNDDEDREFADERYVAGPSVHSLKIGVNGVSIPTRDDASGKMVIFGDQSWGSCPFVFANTIYNKSYEVRGTVLTRQIGAESEGRTTMRLGRGITAIQIRELEPEVTKINSVQLRIYGPSGRTRYAQSRDPRLRAKDDRYVTLKRGDTLQLDFSDWPAAQESAEIEIVGYYTPLPARHRDLLAMRLSEFGR